MATIVQTDEARELPALSDRWASETCLRFFSARCVGVLHTRRPDAQSNYLQFCHDKNGYGYY